MTSESDLFLTTHAKSSFDPALFSSLFYGGNFPDETAGKLFDWLIKQFHDIFNDGMLKGEQLLDIGTGPVVHPVVTASKWFDKIYLSDFSSSNIEFLQRWRRGQLQHMKYLMKSSARMEGQGATWETLHQRVLGKVKEVVKCDVNRHNPLSETILEDAKFDVITSCNCLQVATLTAEAFEKALRNISTLLKPGGHLVVVNFLDETYYKVGAKKFQALSLTSEELQRAFKDSGFVIERLTMWTYGPMSVVNDGTTIYSMVAKKQS